MTAKEPQMPPRSGVIGPKPSPSPAPPRPPGVSGVLSPEIHPSPRLLPQFSRGEFARMSGSKWDGRLVCVLSISPREYPYEVSVVPERPENFITTLQVRESNLKKLEAS